MLTRFRIPLFGAAFLAACWLLSAAAVPVHSTLLAPANARPYLSDPELTVTPTSETSVQLSWDAWSGTGNYTVTVTNLTAFQVEQSFQTSLTGASVSDLINGDTYRFSVAKNGFVIVEDVIL